MSTAYNANYASQLTPAGFHICLSDDDSIFTCDVSGGVRKWQVGESSVLSALRNWRNLFGQNEDSLRIEFEKDDFDFSKLDSPKIGKFDPSNTPHVGGSTWAGGTGGYNTAGLGGVGGPFRLDAGHDVHQLSQEAKDAVPEHIKRKAREIARKEYQKRLKEIEMSSFEADAYNQIYNRIEKQTKMLRTVIDSLEAKAKEREWVRHQTTGDLDDAKLVEGITGEKSIYRRRMDKEPESGALLKKPKRLRICFDVSGSMYRFNGYDNRLQRSLESALLVMEALKGNENKIKYDIQGHSGDAPDICFVKVESPPRNEKERFDVLKKMLAHTQFCMSGDHTLEAIDSSVQQLAKEDADERFLIVLSDANLNRYGISPEEVLKFMNADEKVRVFLILIGSLGEQAKRMKAALPPGRSFVCTDTTQMPQIMQNIFSSAVID